MTPLETTSHEAATSTQNGLPSNDPFDRDQAQTFLQTLWPSLRENPAGYVEARPIGDGHANQEFFDLTEGVDAAVANLLDYVQEHVGDRHIYFGVNPRCPTMNEDGEEELAGGSENVQQMIGLWADLDGKDYQGGLEEAQQRIDEFPLDPTITVQSGNGFHVYFLFGQAMSLQREDDRQQARRLNELLQSTLQADATPDVARLMRLPGTPNIKHPNYNDETSDHYQQLTSNPDLWEPCQLIDIDEARRYSPQDLEEYLPSRQLRDAVQKTQRDRFPDASPDHEADYDLPEDCEWLDEALDHIPARDYWTWIRVGMALREQFGEAGFEIWDEWSRGSNKYEGRDETRSKWDSFDSSPARPVTLGTIWFLAEEHGWEPPSRTKALSAQSREDRARAALNDLEEEMDQDAEEAIQSTLKDYDRLQALAQAREEKPGPFNALMNELEDATTVRRVNSLRQVINQTGLPVETDFTVGLDEPEPSPVHEVLPHPPVTEGPVIPEEWAASETGIRYASDPGDDENRCFCSVPVLVTGLLRDVDSGQEYLRIAWWKNDEWHHLVVPRRRLADRQKILSLSDHGLPVTSNNATDLIQFLDDFVAENRGDLPTLSVAHQMGWHEHDGQRGFLWGESLVTESGTQPASGNERVDPDEDGYAPILFYDENEGRRGLARGFQQRGSLEAWREAIEPVADYPRVKFVLYASLVPPLLELFETPNFVVDVCGPTSSGKSVAQSIGASCWGNPDQRQPQSALFSWDNTTVFLERASATLNGLPLILDDTKTARYEDEVARVIYEIVQGQGRGRGSKEGLRQTRNWRTVLISSGEEPAVDYTEDGGTRARVLTLWGRPFGSEDQETARMVERMNHQLQRHYGHAGPAMIRHLLGEDTVAEWQTVYETRLDHYINRAGDRAVAARMASYFAVIEVAAWLADGAVEFPWVVEDPIPKGLWEQFVKEGSQADRPRAALKRVISWVQANEDRFTEGTRDGQEDYGLMWGDDDPLRVFPHILRDRLDDAGFQPQAILRSWDDRGWLVVDDSDKGHQKQVYHNGMNQKMYAIRADVIERLLGHEQEELRFDGEHEEGSSEEEETEETTAGGGDDDEDYLDDF